MFCLKKKSFSIYQVSFFEFQLMNLLRSLIRYVDFEELIRMFTGRSFIFEKDLLN